MEEKKRFFREQKHDSFVISYIKYSSVADSLAFVQGVTAFFIM